MSKWKYRKPDRTEKTHPDTLSFQETYHREFHFHNLTRQHLKERIDIIRVYNPKASSIGITVKYLNPYGKRDKTRVSDKTRRASSEFILKDVDERLKHGSNIRKDIPARDFIQPTGYIVTLKYIKK